jgi:hypothetical protein
MRIMTANMTIRRSNSKKSKRNPRRQRSRSWRRRKKRNKAKQLIKARMMRKMMMSDEFICLDDFEDLAPNCAIDTIGQAIDISI